MHSFILISLVNTQWMDEKEIIVQINYIKSNQLNSYHYRNIYLSTYSFVHSFIHSFEHSLWGDDGGNGGCGGFYILGIFNFCVTTPQLCLRWDMYQNEWIEWMNVWLCKWSGECVCLCVFLCLLCRLRYLNQKIYINLFGVTLPSVFFLFIYSLYCFCLSHIWWNRHTKWSFFTDLYL